MDGKIDAVLIGQERGEEWQKLHEKTDIMQLDKIHARISTMKSHSSNIAIIAGTIGVLATAGWQWVKKQVL